MTDPIRGLRSQRVDYNREALDESGAPDDPLELFGQWYGEALRLGGEANAMVLATVGDDGAPSARTVLLKDLDEGDFVFYTNYVSRKARELAAHPACALMFPWYPLQRQVRVEGLAARVSRAESENYFASRPRDAQLGAWASPQSEQVPSRQDLEQRLEWAAVRFRGRDVECPPSWGGYRVTPLRIEFWQGRPGRLHDRLLYQRTAPSAPWTRVRLAP